MGVNHLKTVRDGSRTRPSKFCEHNGGCNICEGNRMHKHQKQRTLTQEIDLFNEEEYWMFFEDEYWVYFF
jgi:hypothetical protein